MTFRYPLVLALAALLTAAAVAGYVLLQRRRAATLAAAGLSMSTPGRRGALRRHLPYALFLAAIGLLLVGAARPQATVEVPRAAGTVILAFDVSNSMAATDVEPSRLAAAQDAAIAFVEEQPDTIDIGVVVFGQQALTTVEPTDDHAAAVAAIQRMRTGGGTSLGQAILAALGQIVGEEVVLPEDATAEPPDLGYWRSATIVLFSDGEQTGGPDAEEAATLAADAGVRVETVGIGTEQGATVEVDGFQLATAIDEELLTTIAETTGGSYHRARDAAGLHDVTSEIDLRVTAREETLELTAVLAGSALLLLTIGALVMIRSSGRIV